MMVTQYLHLLWRILRLIVLENNPMVLPGNEHLAIADALTMRCMITPDCPFQIVLSQIPCQRAVKGLGKSDIQRARYQGEIRQPLQRLQQGRVGHALCPKTSTRNYDACIVVALATHTEETNRLPLKLSVVDPLGSIRYYPWRRCRSSPTGITPIITHGKECRHAQTPTPDSPPPPPAALSPQLTPQQIWMTLPAEHRRKTLQTLSRIVAHQLYDPHNPPEVSHEDG
jgi:hypothetical protein